MENRAYKIFEIIITGVVVVWCALLLMQKIDLSRADIGRHIKNGEVLMTGSWQDKIQILNTNYYSYTEKDFPFVNHHWGSGIVFYSVYQTFGWKGLSIFYIALVTLAFYLLFKIAKKEVGVEIASILSVLVLPIITQRAEIRPEAFTYLFISILFYVLWKWQKNNSENNLSQENNNIELKNNKRYSKSLFLLPILMLAWVNLHVGFIFGFMVLGSFWIRELINYFKTKEIVKLKTLSIISFLSVIAALINPFFIKGFLYPLKIFENYGYLVLENQSIHFLENLNITNNLHFGLFKILVCAGLLSFVFLLFKKEARQNFPFQNLVMFISVSVLSYFAIRNFPIFALLFLPIIAINLKQMSFKKNISLNTKNILISFSIIILIASSLVFWKNLESKKEIFGIGLLPNMNAAAEFFKSANLKGPIFNNYDIGGYLIFHLFPKEKMFVDNRPEAFSTPFFKEVYVPMQENGEVFKEIDQKYNFNAIFFSHLDLTPWAQKFLIQEVNDPDWAPVFADSYNIIFLKRTPQNATIIQKYEIPKENFGVK